MRIADLIHGLDVKIVNAGEALGEPRVLDITEDSRRVGPGSLFIARKGEKADGKAFIAGAIAAGAVAVLTDDPGFVLPGMGVGGAAGGKKEPGSESRGTRSVAVLAAGDVNLAIARLAERFFGDPSSKMTVIGVTGTNGKTTTTFLIHQMLNALGIRCGLIGTVVIDDGFETVPASLTTPPAIEVARTLARMHEAGCKAVVMEVSSHALHQKRVGGIRFNAAVFTNLTGDHLDYHKTMEEYGAVKAMLFEGLPADGVAVVNIQDAAHSRMVRGMSRGVRVVRCTVDGASAGEQGGTHWQQAASGTTSDRRLPIGGGTAPETVCRARVVGADTCGTDVEFVGGGWGGAGAADGGGRKSGGHRCRIPLVGAFNVMNALQAIATVHALWGGTDEDALSFDIIAGALERASAPPGRLEPVTAQGELVQVFVDYAHTDDALATVLGVLRGASGSTVPQSRVAPQLWCVFGCGGDRDRTKRPRMGKVAAQMADRVIITSDNPRTEDPATIIEQIRAGIGAAEMAKVMVEPDREAAIRLAVRECRPGDTLIIAGKGHEDYQILPDPAKPGATIKRHFDDREVARAALRERGIGVREPADRGGKSSGASLVLGG